MNYDQVIIFYFSGTGNARNAAQWILNTAKEKGLKTQLINIEKSKPVEIPEASNKTLFGFCSPTHGFNMPPIMLKFISQFPRLGNNDAFILNTRGGLKLYKYFVPGVSGIAQLFPALILRLKGLRIVGMQPLDLPSNWLILHPGLRKKVVQSIYSRCEQITSTFAENLLHGKRKYKALLSLPLDLALIPIAIGYYFIGRFFLAKTLIATNACNNCEKCIIQCPVESIKMVNDRPFWKYSCESCMRCINACPSRAIETTHTYSGLLVVISFLVLSPLIIKGLNALEWLDWLNKSAINGTLLYIFNSFILVVFVFLAYRLIHFMMRFTLVNKLITYTSLSKFKFWRRYKSPNIRAK
jgi:Pyruvate/2-oxoacid:ferredoxin oxidoreductase delta subunit